MRRAKAIGALLVALLLAAAVATVWLLRFRLATGAVERRLAAAHVPASFRLTRIGPFHERMEALRIGDPAHPDLTARRIDVLLGYGPGGAFVRRVEAEGVRLQGQVNARGLSLGALDRLLPHTRGGGAALPDLDLAVQDAAAVLETPAGALRITLGGNGNPQHAFSGSATVQAPALRLATCTVSGMAAQLAIAVHGGMPGVRGPVRIGGIRCPRVTLGAGSVQLAASADAALDRFTADGTAAGFAGEAGPARFAALAGPMHAGGGAGAFDLHARMHVAGLSLPQPALAAGRAGVTLAGTPLGPTAARAGEAFGALLAHSDADADFGVALRDGRVAVALRQVRVSGKNGGHVLATAHDGLGWAPGGWRADADVAMGGGALPPATLRLRQPAPGAPLVAQGEVGPYRAGTAAFTLSPLTLHWADGTARIDGAVLIDGPFGAGDVRGLALPIHAIVRPGGGFALGTGCEVVSARAARIGSFRFDDVRLPLCGAPLVRRTGTGPVAVAATLGAVRLHGRTTTGTPVSLALAGARLTPARFEARQLDLSLGEAPNPTHLLVGSLDGQVGNGAVGGSFDRAGGTVGAVPLRLSDAAGRWSLDGGVLRLAGALRVSDTAAAPRFRPLDATDTTLTLAGSRIAAHGTLREPTTRAAVSEVTLSHDLGSGRGEARLAVPALAFAPKGLQPDQLTPLTLGVVANVSGTIRGEGRIGWGPEGTTSTGRFATDRLDLAAAFGPVTGIKGAISFSDLLGLVTPPGQQVTVAEINPGVAIDSGTVRFHLPGDNQVAVEGATWPFAGGTLRLEPTTLDFGADAARHLTFRITALDAAAFVQQLAFPNISATGTFDGVLPMLFDGGGGRIVAGSIAARPPGGTLAYVGELTTAQLGTMGKLAFDALKAIRYSALRIDLDGQLDGEMVSRVRFTGVREATADRSIAARLIRNLPFRFNIQIRAPFRGLVGSARAYLDPKLLLVPAAPAATIQPPASGPVR